MKQKDSRGMAGSTGWLLAGSLIALLVAPAVGLNRRQSPEDWENETIGYVKATPSDAVSRLQSRLDSGRASLKFDPVRGYLPSVLTLLNIPLSSQTLVFSKTSFQHQIISPASPRALYFNDDCYIGWVQGGPVLEAAVMDPTLGTVFYTLAQTKDGKPRFERRTDDCLECHGSTMTGHIPGFVMRSVYATPDGTPDFSGGSYVTTDESPLRERWGGWYVTGRHGAQRHMGNSFARNRDGEVTVDMDRGANVTNLSARFDTAPYLAKTSDIVSLMVMEHQTHLQNLITKAGYQTRIALAYEQALNTELHNPAGNRLDSTMRRIEGACEPLVKAMLFSGEAEITDPIVGTSGYAEQFAAAGSHDSSGRSLRQLDLKTRLLRYPCSWTIYSAAFDALPDLARNTVYRRLREVLSGKDQDKSFAHLRAADRTALFEILTQTRPGFVAAHPAV